MTWTRRGSSPRAWGILHGACLSWHGARFIPTCVGNTTLPGCYQIKFSVHPHVRGEYRIEAQIHGDAGGSSPRAWGIRWAMASPRPRLRFIPTCVGNTKIIYIEGELTAVHPHVRGEYPGKRCLLKAPAGSSPRAWGIRIDDALILLPVRFIPTCVGNTPPDPPDQFFLSVHPHVRGEYSSRKHEEFLKVIIAAKIYRSGTA